jgi:hypothetical protein
MPESNPFIEQTLYTQSILNELKRHGFISDSGLRIDFRQHGRCIGCPTEYYVDFYPQRRYAEIYSRQKRGTQSELTERFSGLVESALDLARLLWQVDFITAADWQAAQERLNAKQP